MSYGRKLEKIETIDIPEYNRIDINDAIEFYEIKKYFDDSAYSKSWISSNANACVLWIFETKPNPL